MNITTRLNLNDGNSIPQMGLGVYRSKEGDETYNAVMHALKTGYRHIDTAALYGNEESVGRAVRDSGIPRDEIFITTKLWNDDHGYDDALNAFDQSMSRLGLDYLDLYLIHWPVRGKRLNSWKALEYLKDQGRVRSIGVSNYMENHLSELLNNCNIKPAANQIELHPFNYKSRSEVISLCDQHDIRVIGYCPLARGARFDDPTLNQIAKAHDKTVPQVMLRWGVQRNICEIPKSSNPGRITENGSVYDFTLNENELADIDSLDENLAVSWDPTKAE